MKLKVPVSAAIPELIEKPDRSQIAVLEGLTSCLHCGHTVSTEQHRCDVCNSKVHVRKENSLNSSIAFLIASILLFFPANILPMLSTGSILGERSDTVLSGIIALWQSGSPLVAMVVFLASFITPVFKMISMTYLCYTCKRKSTKHLMFRIKLYQITELIGRWSMIDVFVVSLLAALVQMGAFATMSPGPGIIAFASVVVLTMLSANAFDPRLIWDNYNNE